VAGVVGGHVYGVSTWQSNNQPTTDPFHQGVIGLLSVFLAAGFSFQGTELVGVTAGESAHPAKAVPRAIRQVFWRILLFYCLAIFVVGLIVPYDDPRLLSSNTTDVAVSPFTLVFLQAGIPSAAHLMNAVILITVFSAGNSGMYAASRTLLALAESHQAPRIFARVTKRGVPVPALILTTVIGSLTFLSSLFGDGQVYIWLLSVSGVSGLLAWLGIALAHYRFRRALIRQCRPLDQTLIYRAPIFPTGPILSAVVITVIILGQGVTMVDLTTGQVNVQQMVAAYIGIPIFAALYIGYKLAKKTRLIPLSEVDLDSDRYHLPPLPTDIQEADDAAEKSGTKAAQWWRRARRSPFVRFLNNL